VLGRPAWIRKESTRSLGGRGHEPEGEFNRERNRAIDPVLLWIHQTQQNPVCWGRWKRWEPSRMPMSMSSQLGGNLNEPPPTQSMLVTKRKKGVGSMASRRTLRECLAAGERWDPTRQGGCREKGANKTTSCVRGDQQAPKFL